MKPNQISLSALEKNGWVEISKGVFQKKDKINDIMTIHVNSSLTKEKVNNVKNGQFDKLNKWEKRFWEFLYQQNGIYQIKVQDLTLRIGDDCRYTPDFTCVGYSQSRLDVFEVKGFMREDALVKIKAVARQYREFTFWIVTMQNNEFKIREIKD